MSRSKYVSVGDTGGLILDSKYDDFATNAGLQSVKNEIVSAIEAGNAKVQVSGTIASELVADNLPHPGLLNYELTYPEPAQPTAITGAMGINTVIFAKDPSVGENGRLYGMDTQIRYSDNNGAFFGVIWNASADPSITQVMSARRLSNGRILVVVRNTGETPSWSMWASDLADDASKTFSKVHDFQQGYPQQTWGWDTRTENLLLCSEYKETSQATEGTNARFAYMSRDGGLNWQQIFEGPTDRLFHIHDIGYDPYHNTIYIVTGDSTWGNVYYSHDYGQTWNTVWPNDGTGRQYLSISALPHCILFGTDESPNGIDRLNKNWRRGQYQTITPADIDFAYKVDDRAALTQIFHSSIYANGAHYFATWTADASPTQSYIIGTKDGVHFYDIFVSQVFTNAQFGVRSLFSDGENLIGSWRDAPGVNRKIELPLPKWEKL